MDNTNKKELIYISSFLYEESLIPDLLLVLQELLHHRLLQAYHHLLLVLQEPHLLFEDPLDSFHP